MLITKPFSKEWVKLTPDNFSDVLYTVKTVGAGHQLILVKGHLYIKSFWTEEWQQHPISETLTPENMHKLEPFLSSGRVYAEIEKEVEKPKKKVEPPKIEEKKSEFEWF